MFEYSYQIVIIILLFYLQQNLKNLKLSDGTIEKLEEAAKELTLVNHPTSHEVIENEVCSIKDRIARLLNSLLEKFQQVQHYDKKMKNVQDKIKNVNDLLDKVQISATDSTQVRYVLSIAIALI